MAGENSADETEDGAAAITGNLSVGIYLEERGDEFFNDAQRSRLRELMFRRRRGPNKTSQLSTEEQSELEQLIDAELRATILRAEAKLERPDEELS